MNNLITLIILIILLIMGNNINAQDAKKVGPIFENGEAQIIPEFSGKDNWITHDLWVETDFNTDGDDDMDRMHVSVTRPIQTDTESLKLPVVYNTSPYFAGVAEDIDGIMWNVKHNLGEKTNPRTHPEVKRISRRPYISMGHINEWVPRGYIVVHSCSPGTGLSDGAPTIGGKNESLAPKAVIEWLCGKRPGYTSRDGDETVDAFWSTGKVGMTGTSYNGTLPIAAASTGVEGLEAIIPIAPNTSYYHYYRSNGLVRSPGGYLGEDIDVLYDFVHSGEESNRPYNNRVVRDSIMRLGMDRKTGDYNSFWKSRDYIHQLQPMKAALLMSHGFNDWNVMPEHSYRIYKAASDMGLPTQIYYHQGGHGGPPPMKMMNRWFTRYLHGVENDVEKDAKAWIVREDDQAKDPTPYSDYPNPAATQVTLYLNNGAPGTGSLQLTENVEATPETIVDNYSFSGKTLAKAEYTNHRLMFLSPTLQNDLHISGEATINIKVACNKEATNLSVWLVSLPWKEGKKAKIHDNIITRGWADPQNHNSLEESTPMEPGKYYDLQFKLMPDDQVIKKGQQIGLMIMGSDREFTLWPEPGTELTVDVRGTSIELPIVNGLEAYKEAIQKK